jgi:hypothetical protein
MKTVKKTKTGQAGAMPAKALRVGRGELSNVERGSRAMTRFPFHPK